MENNPNDSDLKSPEDSAKLPEDVNIKGYEKDYNEISFWDKIKKYAVKLGVKPLYITFLLYYTIPKASILDKTIIIGSLGYLISPLDLIMDCIPVIGLADDIAVLMFCYYRIKKNIDDETREKARDKIKSIFFDNFDDKEIKKL